MRRTLFIVSVILCALYGFGQEVQQHCGSHPNLLHDSAGKLKWLTPKELQLRATAQVNPKPVELPGGRQYEGFVSAKIMVDGSGDIVCIWNAAGHPIMIPSAITAIHQWKFRPMIVNGKKVEFVGQLKVLVRSTEH